MPEGGGGPERRLKRRQDLGMDAVILPAAMLLFDEARTYQTRADRQVCLHVRPLHAQREAR